MKVYIVYFENGYDSYSVVKIFSTREKAYEFISQQSKYDQGLFSVEEDIVE